MRRSLVVVALLASGCAHRASVRSDEGLIVANARTVLAKHCGSCHLGSSPNASRAALDVFDLEQTDWHLRLSAEQLEGARIRVDSPTVNGKPSMITAEERVAVTRFFRRESRRRAEATSIPLNWRVELAVEQ